MSTQEKSPSSPTKSDESPQNTIRVIKTNDADNTMVEVKVAGESGEKVTIFGGDGNKTENRADDTKHATEENSHVHQSGSSTDNAVHQTDSSINNEIHQTGSSTDNAIHQTGSSTDNAIHQTESSTDNTVHQTDYNMNTDIYQTGSSTDNVIHQTGSSTDNAVHQIGSSMDNTGNKTENEDKNYGVNESVSETKRKENNSDIKDDKKKDADDNYDDADKPLEPMTQEEIDKIVSKYAKMDKKELDKYLAFFWSVDTFGFGVFTIHQLAYRLHEMGRRISSLDIAKMFSDIDANNDFLVSLDEFLEEMSKEKRKKKTTEDWQAEFERCDRNKDGFICEEDIKTILEERNVDYNIVNIFKFLYNNSTGEDMKLNVHEYRRAAQKWQY